tara:strand:+ start:638 stop:1492 length:855 start_codon:yes stop_codon:yes gene_type:complete
MISNKIILGSAQFGQRYGVTNYKKIQIKEIKKIIAFSKKKKIKFIDTAHAYGKSEKILGNINIKGFKVITKIKINKDTKNVEKIFNKSKKNLKIKNIYGVLFHNCESLLTQKGLQLFNNLNDLKKKKLISKIGVSIYDPNDFFKLKKKGFKFDIIQIPFSIFDKRFLKKDILKKMRKTGAEIHARSVFLQGLLLSDEKSIPKNFKKWSIIWKKWNNFILTNKLKKINVCLNFVLQNKYINKVVLGFTSLKEFKELFRNYKKIDFKIIDKSFTSDIKLINPKMWK